ncbi:alpha/beta hydrolase [Leucobacter allii]|uniref:Alpha/beta hydrolase n=1 Tax=Leucobacter allii TaxID=2932247 RepID=A0ABY4FKP0_9MICO|nr:alpha/beta hydrolase fold domain-containing protein [Leucobacter allii]UOQ56827.1 alpha/beta hydrolase [Leucobacter allii]
MPRPDRRSAPARRAGLSPAPGSRAPFARASRRGLRAALGVAAVLGIAAALGVGATVLLGRGGEPARAAGGAEREEAGMRITDLVLAGPAATARPGTPNRLGSASVPVRRYEPAAGSWATLVWAHGGSFVHGGLDWPEADWAARRFAEAGLRVYSVDYALASEAVQAPAGANDVGAVLDWALAEHAGEPVAVGGASAGGHLAAQAALDAARARAADPAERGPAALVLEYPTLHRVQRPDPAIAAVTAALPEARRFPPERIAAMYDVAFGGDAAAAIPVGERAAAELALLPPTVIVNADADDLRASAEQFAEQLRAAGVPVTESVQPGTVHGYLNRPEESERARADARDTIGRFVAELRRITGPAG